MNYTCQRESRDHGSNWSKIWSSTSSRLEKRCSRSRHRTALRFARTPALLVDHAGAESNTAVGLARLGLRTAWVSRLGADAAGDRILAAISRGRRRRPVGRARCAPVDRPDVEGSGRRRPLLPAGLGGERDGIRHSSMRCPSRTRGAVLVTGVTALISAECARRGTLAARSARAACGSSIRISAPDSGDPAAAPPWSGRSSNDPICCSRARRSLARLWRRQEGREGQERLEGLDRRESTQRAQSSRGRPRHSARAKS